MKISKLANLLVAFGTTLNAWSQSQLPSPILPAPAGTNAVMTDTSPSLRGNLPAEPLVVRVDVGGEETLLRFDRSQLLEQLGQFKSTYEFSGETLDSVLAGLAKLMGKGFEMPVPTSRESGELRRPVFARYVDKTPYEVFHSVAYLAGFVVRDDGSTLRLVSPTMVRREDLVLRVYETKFINIYNYADAVQVLLSPVGKLIANAAAASSLAGAKLNGGSIVGAGSGGGSGSSGGGGSSSGSGGAGVASVGSDKDVRSASMPNNSFSFSVLDLPEVHESIAKFIASVDKPRRQIAVQMRLYEFANTKDPSGNRIGIDWTRTLNPNGNGIAFSAPNTGVPKTPPTFDPSQLVAGGVNWFSPNRFIVQSSALGATLNFIESQSKGRLMEAPNIIAQHGVTALLRSVEKRPYLSGESRNSSGGASESVAQVTFADIGTTLNVTPFIEDDTDPDPGNWTIYLDLKPEISLYQSDVVINGNSVPVFSARAPTTQVRVRNGDTVFLGGITSQSFKESWQGVPGLSKIPVLRYIFGSQSKGGEEREMAILVTGSIIDIDQKALPAVASKELNEMIASGYGKKPYLIVPQGTRMDDPAYTTGRLVRDAAGRQKSVGVDPARVKQLKEERERLEAERQQRFEQLADDFRKRDETLRREEGGASGLR